MRRLHSDSFRCVASLTKGPGVFESATDPMNFSRHLTSIHRSCRRQPFNLTGKRSVEFRPPAPSIRAIASSFMAICNSLSRSPIAIFGAD